LPRRTPPGKAVEAANEFDAIADVRGVDPCCDYARLQSASLRADGQLDGHAELAQRLKGRGQSMALRAPASCRAWQRIRPARPMKRQEFSG
jgi:hypothetical protein